MYRIPKRAVTASVTFEDGDVLRRPGIGPVFQRLGKPCQAGLEIGIVGLGEERFGPRPFLP